MLYWDPDHDILLLRPPADVSRDETVQYCHMVKRSLTWPESPRLTYLPINFGLTVVRKVNR